MLTNAPLAGGYFCQHPAQGCVRNITGMETVTAILLIECDPDRYLSDPDARNVS